MTSWLLAISLAFGQASGDRALPLDDELAVPAIRASDDAPTALPIEREQPALEVHPVSFETPPVEGRETLVVVHDGFGRPERGATVQVVHRPGLHGERTEAIGITDSRGRVRWTPAQGGVAVVRAGREERVVSVAWIAPGPETASVLGLLCLAGLLMSGYGLLPRRRRKKTA